MLLRPSPGWSGVSVGVAARMSGLTSQQLRRYHAAGWLVPSLVDEATGHRRYSQDDVERARLLAALRGTGMPIDQAGRAVREDGDRVAVLEHLTATQERLEIMRRLLPPARPGQVRELRFPHERMLAQRLAPDADVGGAAIRAAVDALRARAASHLAVGIEQLPRQTRPERLPTGPAVCRRWSADHDSASDISLELPWLLHEVPDGLEIHDWWPSDVLICNVSADVSLDAAHQALEEAVDRSGRIEWAPRRELLDPDLTCTVVVASVTR